MSDSWRFRDENEPGNESGSSDASSDSSRHTQKEPGQLKSEPVLSEMTLDQEISNSVDSLPAPSEPLELSPHTRMEIFVVIPEVRFTRLDDLV
jgi:hypothetical protein